MHVNINLLNLKQHKWTNKERVLVFSSRGIGFRDRHLMKDFKTLMPHSKTETKMDKKDNLKVINEVSDFFIAAKTKLIFFVDLSNEKLHKMHVL